MKWDLLINDRPQSRTLSILEQMKSRLHNLHRSMSALALLVLHLKLMDIPLVIKWMLQALSKEQNQELNANYLLTRNTVKILKAQLRKRLRNECATLKQQQIRSFYTVMIK